MTRPGVPTRRVKIEEGISKDTCSSITRFDQAEVRLSESAAKLGSLPFLSGTVYQAERKENLITG